VVEPSVDSTHVEGDEVTFTCQGNVGGQNAGQLVWFYYIGEEAFAITDNVTDFAPVPVTDDCSYTRQSVMKLKLTRGLDNALVRCTVQQDIYTADGDEHKQTLRIPVQCK